MLHLQESQFNQIFVHYYTNRPGTGAHECVVYSTILRLLLYAQAQTRREWVESIVARISFAFFATYFSMPISVIYGLLRFEFHTKEIACACKSLCTKHVRHCVLRYIREFKNPRANVVGVGKAF